jgi:hypothetical protein
MSAREQMKVTREQVLAYRFAAQGLAREARSADALAVLDIGVQDASPELARLAFDARLADTPPAELFGPGQPLALVWSLRGAPHVHRRADLTSLAGALYPLSEADAAARLNETGPSVARQGIPALEQFALAAVALRDAVPQPTAKGAASTAATKAIPAVLRRQCRACKTAHISDSAMRTPSLAAGLELQPGTSPPVLQRQPRARLRRANDPDALRTLLRAYLRLLGPATIGDAAGYVDARRADVAELWSAADVDDSMIEVSVDGRAAVLPAEAADLLADPPEPDRVRLLGGLDPFMQARDRDVLVPDKAAHKVLWPVLGRPGVLLVDGEVAGIWRPKASGTSLTLAVEAFGSLSGPVWTAVEVEAERVAAVRGRSKVTVTRRG